MSYKLKQPFETIKNIILFVVITVVCELIRFRASHIAEKLIGAFINGPLKNDNTRHFIKHMVHKLKIDGHSSSASEKSHKSDKSDKSHKSH